MKFKVTCKKDEYGRRYLFEEWTEKLKGEVGLLVVSDDELERRSGKDGMYLFNFGGDHFAITTLRHWGHILPQGLFHEEKADGIFYKDYIKVHYRTLKEKLSRMEPEEEIKITTWDQEYNQEAITHDLNEVRKNLNREIEKRQTYGVRTYKTPEPGYILFWSNNQAQWLKEARFYLPDTEIKLDANMLYAPFTQGEIDAVIPDLAPLPLYAYSLEAKAAIAGRPREDLEKGLHKLESELEIAKLEEDLLKQRNIGLTMNYIKSLLEGSEQGHIEEHIT